MYLVKAIAIISIAILPMITEAESKRIQCYDCSGADESCTSPNKLNKTKSCYGETCMKKVFYKDSKIVNVTRNCLLSEAKSKQCGKEVDQVECLCNSDFCNAGISTYFTKFLYTLVVITIVFM